jgi:hypothetical protein
MTNATNDTAGAGTSAGGDPPYKCELTLVQGVCLRFNRDPVTGHYDSPPGGIRMRCADCQYFFEGPGPTTS